jgi:hypothetical protein
MLNDQGSHDVLQLHQPVRRRPANKGRRYPADPPRVEETIGVMREAGEGPYGRRMRALMPSSGVPACASPRPSPWRNPTSSQAGAQSLFDTVKAEGDGRSAWTIGVGSTFDRGLSHEWRFLSARSSA